jgi:hypothetical protein
LVAVTILAVAILISMLTVFGCHRTSPQARWRIVSLKELEDKCEGGSGFMMPTEWKQRQRKAGSSRACARSE